MADALENNMQRFLFDIREAYALVDMLIPETVENYDTEMIVSHIVSSYMFNNKQDESIAVRMLERYTNQTHAEHIIEVITINLISPIWQLLSDTVAEITHAGITSEDSIKLRYTILNESDLYVTYNPNITREHDDLKRYYKQALENGDYIPERARLILEHLH